MHDAHEFLQTLALVLCAAAVTTVVFQRLRQPVVLGYLLAGMVVGPDVPVPLVADSRTVQTLAELGVILLMFSLGIEFSLSKLLRVGPTAGFVAVVQCSLMIWLGYLVGQAFGWSRLASLYAGAVIAISSTTIIVKAFEEQRIKDDFTHIVFGILIVEDLIAILLITILTALSSGEELTALEVAAAAGRLAAFLLRHVRRGLAHGAAVDARGRAARSVGNDGRRQRRTRVRFRLSRGGIRILRRAGRVSRRQPGRRVGRREDGRAPGAAGARYLRGDLLRLRRHVDRPGRYRRALADCAGLSGGRRRRQNRCR